MLRNLGIGLPPHPSNETLSHIMCSRFLRLSHLSLFIQHSLPSLNVPNHTDECVYPLPQAVFRMYDNADLQFAPPVSHYLMDDIIV